MIGWLVGLIGARWLGLLLVWASDCKVFSRFQCFGLLGLWVFFFFLPSRSLSVLSLHRSLSLFDLPKHLRPKILSSTSHILVGLGLVMWAVGFEEAINQKCKAQWFGLVLGFSLNPKIDYWILSLWSFRERERERERCLCWIRVTKLKEMKVFFCDYCYLLLCLF